MLEDGESETPLHQAQDIIYEAWEEAGGQKRVELAQRALEISPDCADAYVLLAEDGAPSLAESLELYRKGVEAGERALGKEAFTEGAGHFWGMIVTRPYMRARTGLAQSLWRTGQKEEAVCHYKGLLELNPNDNQGIRDLLMPCLIEMGKDEEAERLYHEYDEVMASWGYSRALLDFRREGNSQTSRESVRAALKQHRHVPRYLLGKRKHPRHLPEMYSNGDANEAVIYTAYNTDAWRSTPGALDWLAACAGL